MKETPMNTDPRTPVAKARKISSLEEKAVIFVMAAPFFLAFAIYVAWVVHNGGDPTDHPAPLRVNITGSLLTIRNILGIFVNGAFHAIIAGIVGILVGSTYIVWRGFSQPPAPFETTLDELIGHLEKTKAEIGGGAKVAFSRSGATWPLRLTSIRTGDLPTATKDTDAPQALILNI
jgi:hypothetical protein